ncbi:hypothetical protein Afil01_66280 [Actinorhabdospora filicis]|uniref:Uncharacterized protein n=1 Tax=Actinorhabdospora filicis TaxID=1785913 RepID=A0A9W6SW43_9ACTN|nr:hypothetical protein [Actinorhabdospora filicis]GLZ81821.1 hypothetical protein Afil01_66280 [Actinorhabdospora filicis]
MSQQTPTARGRRVRVLAGALLGAGLLLIASACGDKGGDTPSGGDNGGNLTTKVASLKVCELVDLSQLASTLHSTGYTNGPSDIPKGTGQDPEGPQCSAQLTQEPLGTSVVPPSRLNASVVAYPTADEAAKQYTDRLAAVKKNPADTATDLTGDWTKGSVVVSKGSSDNMIYALVQKDSYLVKIQLQVASDETFKDKWPFTLDEVKATVTETIGKFYTSASGKLAG